MRATPIPLLESHETAPHQLVAAAVIRQALYDLRDPRKHVRETAARFISGESAALDAWCGVLGLPTALVLAAAERFIAGQPERAQRELTVGAEQ